VDNAGAGFEAAIGPKPSNWGATDFQNPVVRAYAFTRIAEVELPEALAYLQNLRKSDIGPDPTGGIWSAAQVALHQATFSRIADPSQQIHYLEDTAAHWWGQVGRWAVDQLCNGGHSESLEIVRKTIHRIEVNPRADGEVAFCEARIDVLSRNQDRVQALASVLSVANGSKDTKWRDSAIRAKIWWAGPYPS